MFCAVVVTIPFCLNHLKGQMLFEMALEATIDQQNMTFNPAKLHSSIKIPFPKSSSIENEYFVYHQTDLFSQSFSAIEGIRRMGKLCDVTLKVSQFIENSYCFLFNILNYITNCFQSGRKHVI